MHAAYANPQGEQEIKVHISDVIQFKELAEQNRPQNGDLMEIDIYNQVHPILFNILEERPLNGKLKDFRHMIRLDSLTVLNLFIGYIQEDGTTIANYQNRYHQLIKICFRCLMTDSEDIAAIAVKILTNYLTSKSPQQRRINLIDVKEEVLAFCEDYLGFLANIPQLARDFPQDQLEQHPKMQPASFVPLEETQGVRRPQFQVFGCRSLKLYLKFLPLLLKSQWQVYDRNRTTGSIGERVIDNVKETLIDGVFQSLNNIDQSNLNYSKLQSISFFLKGIDTICHLFPCVQYLMPTQIEYLTYKYGDIVNFFCILARTIPGASQECRMVVLNGFFQFINQTFVKMTQDSQNDARYLEWSQTISRIIIEKVDSMLDVSVLLGPGQPTAQIIDQTTKLVILLVDIFIKQDPLQQPRQEMQPYQYAKVIQILIVCLLNPITPLICQSTIIFHFYKLSEELKKKKLAIIQVPTNSRMKDFSNYDLQIEIFTALVALCKLLRKQTDQGALYFQQKQTTTPNDEEETKIYDKLQLKEQELVEASNNPFQVSWGYIKSSVDQQMLNLNNQQPPQKSENQIFEEQKKDNYGRNVKNLFLYIEKIIIALKEAQGKPTLSLDVMHLLKKFFVNGCHLIHNLSQILVVQDEKTKEIYKSLSNIIFQLPVSQFKDLLQECGDTIFGLIIEARAKNVQSGMTQISKQLLTFNQQQNIQNSVSQIVAQRNEENFVATFIDMFFQYTKNKVSIFDTKNEDKGEEWRFGLSKQDQRLAKLPFQKIQDALHKKLLLIGEHCLQRANDVRVKHTFFGIFIFCIQQIRSGQIVPKYFYIIRNLWNVICQIDEHNQNIKEIMRDFIPMIQGLIETFLQQKDEVTYVKYTNEICCYLPAKLKHLLDYLPEIAKPLVDCMESNSPEQIESGIHTLQYWLSALATYPELLDPVIQHVLPDLNQCLKPLLFYMPNISLKLMGKLGSKTRQYDHNNVFKPRNYSEDGLKICLTDKHSNEQIIFGIDSVIDVLLIKILSYGDQYSPADLSQAVSFVRSAFLTYVDPDLDIDYLIAHIIQIKQIDGQSFNSFKQPTLRQSFDARQRQEPVSQMTHGSESHIFEKILRCLIIGCSSLPTQTPEQRKVQQEHIDFMAWVTKYFTLIYICKNGTLTQPNEFDEINPLLFIEYIVEFLYFNVSQNSIQKQKQENYRPYYKGSSFAIKTMLRLLVSLYGDQEEAFDNIEIIPLLIKKICGQVDELAKNLAVNIAIKIVIKELPTRTIKKNSALLIKTLFQILSQSADSVVISVCGEIQPTLDRLFDVIGVYHHKLQDISTLEDRNIFNHVVDRVIQNLLSQQQAARQCAKTLLEKIAKHNKVTVHYLLDSVSVQNSQISEQQQPRQISWHDYLYEFELERKSREIFEMYRGGYSQIKLLIGYLDIGKFLLEHSSQVKVGDKQHIFIGIAEMITLLLEEESDKFENVLEQRQDSQTFGPNNTINKLTKRYMKLERLYLQENREYDSYSHTMHEHQFLGNNFFEVVQEARESKMKKDIELLRSKQTHIEMKIYEPQNSGSICQFDKVTDAAKEPIIQRDDYAAIMTFVQKKIETTTQKLFVTQTGRVQDICYDYMSDLYEMYPNVNLHCLLIQKMLQFVSEVIVQETLWKLIKDRQTEFFEKIQPVGPENIIMYTQPQYLLNSFDFYVVSTKAKIICLLFKFFQRDERRVQKEAKQCLKRLLKKETSANEALPNTILKECVRPILNSLSTSLSGQAQQTRISYFQHLSKLIKVCFTCFNEALGEHLTRNYTSLQKSIKEPYSDLIGDMQGDKEHQIKVIVDHYNMKIRQIETATGIINSLHLLCQQKPQMFADTADVMEQALNFNKYLIEEFQIQFEEALNKICIENDPSPIQTEQQRQQKINEQLRLQSAYDKISPLRVKLGYLQSDMMNGVAKFFNYNYKKLQLLQVRPILLSNNATLIQIVKKKENFCLREQMTRDDFIKNFFARKMYPINEIGNFEDKFVLDINLIYTFSKFHPQFLVNQRNNDIVDILREKWVNKVQNNSFLMTENRDIYMKILKTLVIYSRNERSDSQILYDLLKDFQFAAGYLDMRPLIKLCTIEIPNKASIQKKIQLLDSTLKKIKTSTSKFEAKYCMFEFAFMPIALQCANDVTLFNQLFTSSLTFKFFDTFFGRKIMIDPNTQQQIVEKTTLWGQIRDDLEDRQKISYQSFFIEIIKVFLIILRFSGCEVFKKLPICDYQREVFTFLDWCAKNAPKQSLKEMAYFTMSCFGTRLMGLPIVDECLENKLRADTQDLTSSQLIRILQENVLQPIIDCDLSQVNQMNLIRDTLRNCITVASHNTSYKELFWKLFKLQFSLKSELTSRLPLCALISKVILMCDLDVESGVQRRLQKTLDFFIRQNRYSSENPEINKDPFIIKSALINLTKIRFRDNKNAPAQVKEIIQQNAYEIFHYTTQLFDIILYNLPNFPSAKQMQQFSKYSNSCLETLKTIGLMFPNPQIYSHNLSLQRVRDHDKLQLKALFNLNFFSIAISNGFDLPNKINILIDFFKASIHQSNGQIPNEQIQQYNQILSFSSTNYRLILFPIHILKMVIVQKDRLFTDQQLQEFKRVLLESIKVDLRKANERDIRFLQGQIVRDFLKQQSSFVQGLPPNNQPPTTLPPQVLINTRIEELCLIQKLVPHYAIRIISTLEALREQGAISQEEFSTWVDSNFYQETNNLIYRLVSTFRLVVTQEKIQMSSVKVDQNQKQTYENFEFKDNLADFSLEEVNFDGWMKESIVIAIKSIIIHMKRYMHQDEAYALFENLKIILKVFLSVKTCQYLMEAMFEITKILVEDSPQDKIKLLAKEKAGWLLRLMNAQRLKELQDAKENENSVINKAYTLCLDFLDQQPSLQQNEISVKIFDRLFLLKPCCNYAIRQRMFASFEKFTGSAIKLKLQYFMFKVSSEDYEQFLQFCVINNLLDFMLYNFKEDTTLKKLKESSSLAKLHNIGFKFVVPDSIKQHETYVSCKAVLSDFQVKFEQYKHHKLEDMLSSLSEIIRINPEHSHDKNIAEKIFSKIFWQIWEKILHRQEHIQFSTDFNKMAQNLIKYTSTLPPQVKTLFTRTMFEQVVSLKQPQVRVEPEILQFMAKNFNLWHVAIPMLEDHVQLFPQNERYVFALQELYGNLMEQDYSAGLSRITTKSKEMRSLYSFGQHHMWEELNTQFGQYINFYAEQEGLFPFLENQQKMPGKYSRQLAKNALIDMMNGVDPTLGYPASHNGTFIEMFETDEVAEKLNQKKFPKAGSNRSISEIDLRQWENLYIQSLKILKKNEMFKDIQDNISPEVHELKIDYCWAIKDMQHLKAHLQPLLSTSSPYQNSAAKKNQISQGSIQKLKYHLYQSFYLGIQGDLQLRNNNFEDNYRETIKLAIKQWSEILPQYMDRIQNEYLILFQQIIESMEGGRNMISIQETRRFSDYRCAMNIWRERLPNICESIQTWQDILESRNFIFTNLRENINKQHQAQSSGELQITAGAQEEPVDICWNNLKLAEVSRKHGLFGLAQHYLNSVKVPLFDSETRGETLKLERYRYAYENCKLNMITSIENNKQMDIILDGQKFIENKDFEPWMHADIQRLCGEYFLQKGDLVNAKKNLIESIEKNKKEAKTWLSYAKLNEVVHSEKKDEKTIMNSMKGYFCALSLSQHKSRLIIPYLLRLIKYKQHATSKQIKSFLKTNVEQLPGWLWLFWIPQLLQMVKQPKESLQNEAALKIYTKVSKLYPQATYYPLRAKSHYQKKLFKENDNFVKLMQLNKNYLIKRNPRIYEGIESLLKDVMNLFKSQDENFIYILQQILNFSQYIMNSQNEGIEKKLITFYQTIFDHYLKGTNSPVVSEFQKHLINPDTMETDVLKQMQIIKNIKDYLLAQKNLKQLSQNIEEVFPSFSNINVKGIELTDQYILSPNEPLPQKIITIERIDSNVHRAGLNDKKVEFKCQNSKNLVYSFQGLIYVKSNQEKEIVQFYSDERVTQLKIIMNMLFAHHKESHIRGVKLHVAPKILLIGAKLSQDDLNFVDFQETHDFLLQEQGVDPDQALIYQLGQIKQIFETFAPEKPRLLSQLDQDLVRGINFENYSKMTEIVEPNLLQSYFNRIFYNVDNLFIFKKQFTKYHAINSFFSYIFNQNEQLRLSTLVFCKASGKFNFTDAKLSLALQKKDYYRNRSFKEIDEELFKNTGQRSSQNEIDNMLPFRLTPNLVHFIGKIGLEGLFAGVMTSASLALSSQEQKLSSLLKLVFCDEIDSQNQPAQYDEDSNADFCMFRIKSLTENRRILNQPQKVEELKAQRMGGQQIRGIREDSSTGNYVLGQQIEYSIPREYFDLEMERPLIYEEFNKKVFELIEIAQDDNRRSQKNMNWCSWF